ncbi:hypothetical protein TrVE_jg14382 [Triparma verrucosa]|uniref:Uncharacterized protein n=1 Tax=Triparma verrucosa TaxID=1606542 RepID=A0A9W7CJ75_9STRA|nr:hypothetical protein TrVE_jg14382 [Triparma verrucosa]
MVNPVEQSMPNFWTLINTGGSANLTRALLELSPEAQDNYLPLKAIKVSHQFSKDLAACGFYRNNSIQDATKEKQRKESRRVKKEMMMLSLKESLDKETREIAKLQRKLALKQRQHSVLAVAQASAYAIQMAWQRMQARMMVARIRQVRMGTFLSLRMWFLLSRYHRRLAATKLQNWIRIWRRNQQIKTMKMMVNAIKNLQGVCRGWQGRNAAMRRRVIREAVRFVVRTSILFGAARASAELMEPHFAAQIIQKAWKRQLRRRRVNQIRGRRAKMGLKHKPGMFSRSYSRDEEECMSPKAIGDHKRIVGKWTPRSPNTTRYGRRGESDVLGALGGHRGGKKAKRKKKDDSRQHSYFRRGKRDSIVAFTKAAAMISKIHLANGGAWGVRDDEKVEDIVDKKVLDKMKQKAQQAALKIKRRKSLAARDDEEGKEKEMEEDAENYIRVKKKLHMIKMKALQTVIISKSERPTTPPEDLKGISTLKRDLARWTIRLAPDKQEFLRKLDRRAEVAVVPKRPGSVRRPSSAGDRPTKRSEALIKELTEPVLQEIIRRKTERPDMSAASSGSPKPKREKRLSLRTSGLDTITDGRETESPEPMTGSSHPDDSPIHFSASPTHVANPEDEAFDKGSTILGSLMMGIETSPKVPSKPKGLKSTQQSNTPRSRRVSGSDVEFRSRRTSRASFTEIMSTDSTLIDFSAGMQRGLDMEMQRMAEMDDQKVREAKEREEAEHSDDDSDGDEGGVGGIGFGNVVDDAVFVKEAEEVGMTVIMKTVVNEKEEDGEEEEGYGDDAFEEEDGDGDEEGKKTEELKATTESPPTADDEDGYSDEEFEDFEQSASIDLP